MNVAEPLLEKPKKKVKSAANAFNSLFAPKKKDKEKDSDEAKTCEFRRYCANLCKQTAMDGLNVSVQSDSSTQQQPQQPHRQPQRQHRKPQPTDVSTLVDKKKALDLTSCSLILFDEVLIGDFSLRSVIIISFLTPSRRKLLAASSCPPSPEQGALSELWQC